MSVCLLQVYPSLASACESYRWQAYGMYVTEDTHVLHDYGKHGGTWQKHTQPEFFIGQFTMAFVSYPFHVESI